LGRDELATISVAAPWAERCLDQPPNVCPNGIAKQAMQFPEERHSRLEQLLTSFDQERETEYGGERYLVRDNGAVCRLNPFRKRTRPLDKKWTFGRQIRSSGYLHIAGVRVHRIVCSAFHGEPPTESHVVDHIDTNRANNRPENLRWVTRLENVLLNPISMRRIELVYGSIEAFFANPQGVQNSTNFPDIAWMKTVSKEDAQLAKERLQSWAARGSVPSGGALGEWLYGTRERADFDPEPEEFESPTPSVIQVKWKTPTSFPCCPSEVGPNALQKYADKLTFGSVFAENQYGQSLVVDVSCSETQLVVLTRATDNIKDWAVAHVSTGDEFFLSQIRGYIFRACRSREAVCRNHRGRARIGRDH
jgi:hypothetical protein